MTAILGISAWYHDSAAALVVDGQVVAAAQEERFSRQKHDSRFPRGAIDACLRQGGLTPADLDLLAFYEKPFLHFERLLQTYLAFAPRGWRSFRRALPVWLQEKLHLRRALREGLGQEFRGRLMFLEHHESHAASAFFPSPFEEAAVLTMDGVGEWATTSVGVGRGNSLRLTQELRFPHSLGLLYSAFTYYLGFKVNGGEGKVMGLAPYGRPVYRDLILRELVDLKDDGSFRLDQRHFNYCAGLTMTGPSFHRLFGGPPRPAESEIGEREVDLAASVQAATEEIVLRMVRHLHQVTGQRRLTMAGGVALNCVVNGRVVREGPFDEVWIQPAAGDAGGALGAALGAWHLALGGARPTPVDDSQHGSLLGPEYAAAEIAAMLRNQRAEHLSCADDDDLSRRVASCLAEGLTVGWFQGRMEFGPRALGSRSILADARHPRMQAILNARIKRREAFRPFAPIVLRERAHEWFDVPPGFDSPYMLVVAPVREEVRTTTSAAAPSSAAASRGIERFHEVRSTIPAVTHVDYSARLQTVDAQRHPALHRLLTEFHRQTGCAVLVNTSFNVRGEPIVCTPEDAWRCFELTDLDVLAIGRQVVLKQQQPTLTPDARAARWAEIPLD